MTDIIEGNRIDGKLLANKIKEKLKIKITKLREIHNIIPGLAVVLVGDRADSSTYVRMKKQAAEDIGINFVIKKLPTTVTQKELSKEVLELNNNPTIDGMIVQLPLPSHIDEREILSLVSEEKDIDGFGSTNFGNLCMKDREPLFIPCTPKACMTIIDELNINLTGKHVVVIGRSNIVGIPAAMLSLHKNATVTMCHSKTINIDNIVRQADVIIAAVGIPKFVQKDWIKEGAIVIDVGINSIEDSTRKSGYRLVGDVDYDNVYNIVSAITPVPGGVGPMTVISLMGNTLMAAKRRKNIK